MSKPAAKTGTGPTVMVAIEQFFPEVQRIIEDDLAYRVLPIGMRAFVLLTRPEFARDWMVRATEKNLPGIWSGMMCRKRYIDDRLIESASQVEAVVNLGAGFDTRAYRLPTLVGKPTWEVDQEANILSKKRRLRGVYGSTPSNVRLVSVDFDRDILGNILQTHGYPMGVKTFFILEGVTQYLTEKGIRSTFEFLGNAAPNSHLVFTYIRKDFLDGRVVYNWQKAYEKYVAKKIWLFGMNPEEWPSLLKQYGWNIVEDLGAEELSEKYVKPTGRMLSSTQVERIIHAVKL